MQVREVIDESTAEKEGKRGSAQGNADSLVPFRRAYIYFDGLLNKYLWHDGGADSAPTVNGTYFSKAERLNIFFYIVGIMCYKFGLEQYNGSVKALAVDRFKLWDYPIYTFSGYLDGFNACTQCIGSIIVGPLMSIFPIRSILSASLFFFAIISMIIMCIEKANGGTFPSKCVSRDLLPPSCTGAIAGDWDPIGIIPIFVFAGIPNGCIEIVRRIIPQQLVGGNELKLKKLDSLVHMYFEIAGTCGAFFSAYTSLLLGKAYSPLITPILYTFSGIIFYYISPLIGAADNKPNVIDGKTSSSVDAAILFAKSLWYAFYGFGESVYQGCIIVLKEPKYQWLFWGYTIPLVMHRYIEGGVATVYAKSVLNESAFASFINSGSNLGELLGAAFVYFNLQLIHTPLPTIRWDALVLNFAWLYYNVVTPSSCNCDPANAAGIMAAIMCFISAGWSAGDVSLAAYIQASIPRIKTPGVVIANALPSVMSFLYVSNIIIYAVISPMIGAWLDSFETTAKMYDTRAKAVKSSNTVLYKEFTAEAAMYRKDALDKYFYWIAGVFFSLVSVVIFANTFVPKGSWALNPTLIDEEQVENSKENENEESSTTDFQPGDAVATEGPNGYSPVAPAML